MKHIYPREYARTLNYSLGAPRTFRVTLDGKRVFFLRSESSSEKVLDLWYVDFRECDITKYKESILVRFRDFEPGFLLNTPDPEADRLRKERLREAACGITSYSIDSAGDIVAFAVKGDIYVVWVKEVPYTKFKPVGSATDIKVSPDGRYISFVSEGELFVAILTDSDVFVPFRISPEATETVTWGVTDFIAAEEMRRHEGYWWAPDSKSIIFIGVDVSSIPVWYISNPTNPASIPYSIRYPYAGAPNASLSLYLWSSKEKMREILWDKEQFPYLVAVRWRGIEPTIVVQDRSQHHVVVLFVDQETGRTSQAYEKHDELWVELIEGVPSWSIDLQIIDAPDAERRRLQLGKNDISITDGETRKYVGQLDSSGLVYLASEDPTEMHVWLVKPEGTNLRLSERPGVFDAEVGGDTVVVFGTELKDKPLTADVIIECSTRQCRFQLNSLASEVSIRPRPVISQTKQRGINYALLYPKRFDHSRKLPVLMDPYGGPRYQRCIKSSLSYTTSQWFADQGFAVIVADGRGTPGRGRNWEKAVAGNLIKVVLEDQIAVLDDAVERGVAIDPTRVAIRGWSFGGYLAALAAILEPDRFHAAIAGAPVTDWRLYDTHYSERYLGDPATHRHQYDSCSVIAAAPKLRRPLLLIHGLSDDNVVCAHTFQLSKALFEAGREHSVLPLSGITHMAASEIAAENLLGLQLSFLKTALGI